ncbi:hypothetical protein T459_18733 [Capsicum annuum]|uniref:Uncharacterized protein n=1 Tax=Capsicum annuum TaxID=4072 RepID=A0A2G2YZZ1_CAPAN|nr:hypothetical protein T459_18733 [Capsicum annuum]
MKMKNLSLLLLTLTLLFISVCSQVQQTQFVYRWPETYCEKATPTVACTKIPLQFTLVGFWGTDSSGGIQQGCQDTGTYDWAKVFTTETVNKLTAFWPSLSTQDPTEMWKAAWTTYGTCLISKFKTPTQYFNRAIRLSDAIGGGNLLQGQLIGKDGIVPCDSATYTNAEILKSLTAVTTVNNQKEKKVSFTCNSINSTHAYLNQVTFCYTNNAQYYTDCPTTVISKRCNVPNIIVPRPPTPTARASSLQDLLTGEKIGPNVLWETLGQLF